MSVTPAISHDRTARPCAGILADSSHSRIQFELVTCLIVTSSPLAIVMYFGGNRAPRAQRDGGSSRGPRAWRVSSACGKPLLCDPGYDVSRESLAVAAAGKMQE